ncbi:alpha/beta hydrolase [Granulicella aggregans]|uniref:alpha/beta hydrolase n=1 Tax=Granulicella aggregans TaxID=474949 RepID=UPI0021DFA62A|nr:alpha/beta hydrolase [Granulicella aggregans]
MKLSRILSRSALGLVFLIVLGAVTGAAYNTLSLWHYRHQAGIPGNLYDVEGYAMHLYCTGQGSPTIVLDSGLGDDFTAWAKVQPVLSTLTRVCSYDRAGFGWSASRPGLRDADHISGELHQLVAKAGIQRPFVLMGHSIAGIYMRSYAAHYPGDLAGLVFVDGATPLQDDRVPAELRKIQQDQRRKMPLQKWLIAMGWYRMHGMCASVPPGFERYSIWIKADSCIPSQVDAIEAELDAEQVSGEETIHAGPFGALPILIFSRDPQVLPSNWPTAVAKGNAVVWEQMQEEAKGLSSQSRRIIAKDSDHAIQDDRTDLVNQEVAIFLEQVRQHREFADNHSTIEE